MPKLYSFTEVREIVQEQQKQLDKILITNTEDYMKEVDKLKEQQIVEKLKRKGEK